jgi:Flp pilus assembly protein TadB
MDYLPPTSTCVCLVIGGVAIGAGQLMLIILLAVVCAALGIRYAFRKGQELNE